MSEEEIMKILKDTINLFNNDTYCFTHSDDERVKAIQGLLDLYNKEKEKNKELEEESKEYQIGFAQGCYEKDLDWEDKIKAKIEELDYNDIGNFERRCKQEVLQSLLEKE